MLTSLLRTITIQSQINSNYWSSWLGCVDDMTSLIHYKHFTSTSRSSYLHLWVCWLHVCLSWRHESLTCDEPLDRIDMHGAQCPKILSSLFHVDIQPLTMMSRSSTMVTYVQKRPLMTITCCHTSCMQRPDFHSYVLLLPGWCASIIGWRHNERGNNNLPQMPGVCLSFLVVRAYLCLASCDDACGDVQFFAESTDKQWVECAWRWSRQCQLLASAASTSQTHTHNASLVSPKAKSQQSHKTCCLTVDLIHSVVSRTTWYQEIHYLLVASWWTWWNIPWRLSSSYYL